MKRWRLVAIIIAALVAIVALCVGIYIQIQRQAASRRGAAYQTALRSYQEAITPGMTRADVESDLSKKGVQFTHIWGYNHAWADQIQIGQEPAPWYCSTQNVYIVFQFSERPNWSRDPEPADILKSTTLIPRGEGCL